MNELLAIIIYFSFLTLYAVKKERRSLTQSDFVIGNRSLNRWTAAIAAHASDMSNWLFMAYPGMIFIHGGKQIWVAIGLILMMWMNWVVVAPKMRKETEKLKAVTITGFFEHKLGCNWPSGRLITSIFLFLFYTIYIAGTLSGMGLLFKFLFPISYSMGVLIGIALIIPYLLIGGYFTLARVDLFQGLFLLSVILFVPLFIIVSSGGIQPLVSAVYENGKSFALISLKDSLSIWKSLFLMFGWGIGYFGQPHILTKFMGIRDPKEIRNSRIIGISWQFLSLFAATLVGFVGVAVFKGNLSDPEQVFIELVHHYFSPFIAGIFICAILAAIINAVGSMLLVLSTTITEDLYKRFIRTNCQEKEQLLISRLATIFSAIIAAGVALGKIGTIDQLVYYAWSGIGASFGPLVIASLYYNSLTARGAWLGMFIGGGLVAIWPLIGYPDIPSLIIAFPLSLFTIHIASKNTLFAKDRVSS
ncbi:MAG: sodium/proline symporter [Chlamydiae bacterium]|nr:sodium/proline symporter [Chlamydiota bacterium]